MSAHDDRSPGDELTRRYHEANAQDMSRPGAHVRAQVQQHAQAALQARQQAAPSAPAAPDTRREAANQPRWKLSMLASIALAGLTGLLVLQFDRGTPEEKEMVFGQTPATTPGPGRAPAPVPSPAPAAAAAPSQKSAATQTPKAAQPPPAPHTRPASTRTAESVQKATPQESRQPDSAAEMRAAPAQAGVGSIRDNTAAPGLATPPSPFPASPAPAPLRSPIAAPAPAAAMAPPAREGPDSLATSRARGALGFAESATLAQAAARGRAADIDRLLNEGAAIDAADDAGRTPLMLAVINGQESAVRQLLGRGANRDLVDKQGLTALAHARRGGAAGITLLLEAGR